MMELDMVYNPSAGVGVGMKVYLYMILNKLSNLFVSISSTMNCG